MNPLTNYRQTGFGRVKLVLVSSILWTLLPDLSYDDCVVRKNMTCSIKKWKVLFIFSSLKVAMANETTISPTTEVKGDIICMSIHMKSIKLVSMNKWIFRALLDKIHVLKQRNKGDVTRNDSQRRFLAQHWVQMLECSLSLPICKRLSCANRERPSSILEVMAYWSRVFWRAARLQL